MPKPQKKFKFIGVKVIDVGGRKALSLIVHNLTAAAEGCWVQLYFQEEAKPPGFKQINVPAGTDGSAQFAIPAGLTGAKPVFVVISLQEPPKEHEDLGPH